MKTGFEEKSVKLNDVSFRLTSAEMQWFQVSRGRRNKNRRDGIHFDTIRLFDARWWYNSKLTLIIRNGMSNFCVPKYKPTLRLRLGNVIFTLQSTEWRI